MLLGYTVYLLLLKSSFSFFNSPMIQANIPTTIISAYNSRFKRFDIDDGNSENELLSKYNVV